MELQDQLVAIERRLWTNEAAIYENHLIEDALLVFPETGVITRHIAVQAIRRENEEGRRWAEVQFSDVRVLRIGADAPLLTYRVFARWAHETSSTAESGRRRFSRDAAPCAGRIREWLRGLIPARLASSESTGGD